jgi:hypothetical protein
MDYSIAIAEMRVQLGKISEAVRSVVPQSMWAAIVEQLEQHSEPLDVGRTASTLMTPTTPWRPTTRTTSLDLRSVARIRRPRMRRKPGAWTSIDRDFEQIRVNMQTLFDDLAFTTPAPLAAGGLKPQAAQNRCRIVDRESSSG